MQPRKEGPQKSNALSLFFGSTLPSSRLVSIAKGSLNIKSAIAQNPFLVHLDQWDGHQVDNLGDHWSDF